MFQSFDAPSSPATGAVRLARLRAALEGEGLAGLLVPRADAHQGEYVAPCDERLAWLTGFTGSAGFAVVLPKLAGLFVDGRYRLQARREVDLSAFTPVAWPEVKPGPWIRKHLDAGRVAYDPWLHTKGEIDALEAALAGSPVALVPRDNLIDPLWTDRPARPLEPAFVQPPELAGEASEAKRGRIAADLRAAGQRAVVLTLPDSLCWLLNIRGRDIAHNPVVQGFAILHDDARLDLFLAPGKLGPDLPAHLGPEVATHAPEAFLPALASLSGPVRVDRATAPAAIADVLASDEVRVEVAFAPDPCLLPKARKNAAEIAGTEAAHGRDGAAVVEFLAWFDREALRGGLTEIACVTALEEARRATGALVDISFATICGAGPNGAIIHYRVSRDSDRAIAPGDLVVLDSGGQYRDGTTDITRTLPVGLPGEEERAAFTRVLQGMIAISRLRWPQGLAGMHLDALARYPLWLAGQDFDHGTGHGVGAFLSVHEGPQRLSRLSDVPLEPGMILSNEPGYYRDGAFGIRIENLVVVEPAPALPGADDHRSMLALRTLTLVPIDRRLILADRLGEGERAWLDAYHAEVRARIAPRVSSAAAPWLAAATAPL